MVNGHTGIYKKLGGAERNLGGVVRKPQTLKKFLNPSPKFKRKLTFPNCHRWSSTATHGGLGGGNSDDDRVVEEENR